MNSRSMRYENAHVDEATAHDDALVLLQFAGDVMRRSRSIIRQSEGRSGGAGGLSELETGEIRLLCDGVENFTGLAAALASDDGPTILFLSEMLADRFGEQSWSIALAKVGSTSCAIAALRSIYARASEGGRTPPSDILQ